MAVVGISGGSSAGGRGHWVQRRPVACLPSWQRDLPVPQDQRRPCEQPSGAVYLAELLVDLDYEPYREQSWDDRDGHQGAAWMGENPDPYSPSC